MRRPAITNMINDLIRNDPGLADLFGAGGRIIKSTGPGLGQPFKGRQFPTYFRLENETQGRVSEAVPRQQDSKGRV